MKTNRKNNKRNLTLSLMAMLLCVAMLVGSTFAWFTDNATTAVNTIEAGTLKVDLVNADNTKSVKKGNFSQISFKNVNDETDILWEPGATFALEPVKIVNSGNLALKFKLLINGVVGEDATKLAEVLDVMVKIGEATTFTNVGTLSQLIADPDGAAHGNIVPAGKATDGQAETTVGETPLYTIALRMQDTAGNEYQGLSIDGLTMTVMAAQYTYEYDSNNNTYDEKAEYGDVPQIDKSSSGVESGKATVIKAGGLTVTIPADAATNAGTEVSAQITSNAATPSGITVNDGDTVETYDIQVLNANGEKVTLAEGQVYTVELNIGADRTASKLKLYHETTEIVFKSYDETTGILTFETTSFSPYTVVEAGNPTISSAEELIAWAAEINAGTKFQNETYVLTADIDLAGKEWTPINAWDGVLNGTTIDGNGHSIKNMTVSSGDSAGFISNNASSLTIKNLTFEGALVQTTAGNTKYAGVVIGKNYSVVTLENVSVKNSQVRCTWQAGGLVGFAEGNAPKFVNCSIEDSFVGGSNCTSGAFFGLGYVDIVVDGGSVKNVNLYTDMEAALVGYLYGYTLTSNNCNIDNLAVVSEYPA